MNGELDSVLPKKSSLDSFKNSNISVKKKETDDELKKIIDSHVHPETKMSFLFSAYQSVNRLRLYQT